MAELLAKIRELQHVDAGSHWFCDRNDSAPQHLGRSELHERKPSDIELSTVKRQDLIIDCLQLFAYDSPEIDPQKNFLAKGIDCHLGKCDVCIVEYYKVKRRLMEKLRDEYDDEEVATFASIFDDRDIDRINRGLASAERQLLDLPPERRGKDAIDQSALLAVFEALSCEEFLVNQDLVRKHLDKPFQLLQTNVRLQVTHCIPAASVFLFDADQTRCYWALATWTKFKLNITKEDFDFAVRGPLARVLGYASSPMIDVNFVQRLWCGIRLIVDKLDSTLITHSLRAMEFDVCRLALEHLKYDTAGLRFLMQTIEKLLSKAPKDFWDAMGAISPTTFIEQVFNNPQYDKFMLTARKDENYEYSAIRDMLFWVQPFMASLHPSHQPDACRSLAFQLLDRLQDARFPDNSRTECYQTGLGVLIWTLSNCTKEDSAFDTVGRVAAAATLDVTSIYIKDIISVPSLNPDEEKHQALAGPCLRVIETALTLECKSLRSDQEALQTENNLPRGFSSYSPAIWNAVVRALDRGNVMLAKAAFSGVSDLIGLEKFTQRASVVHGKEKNEFNVIFGQLTHLVCQMLERINDFNPGDLDKLFRAPETAIALVSSLFSADASTYEAGVNLIKSISGESARKEAISHLLLPFFETTLNSFSWSVRRIANKKTFASCPRMLKTCTDVLDILSDSQSGLLRVRPLSSISEVKAVEHFWEHQWDALKVIYEMTEDWSRLVGDSAVMKDFCRDTMQFSDHFFDQYSVFASAVDSATIIKQELDNEKVHGSLHVAGKDLLKYPSQTMEAMVKWLRLRDEYLASTSEILITKVLDRLSEWNLKLPNTSSDFLEQVITTQLRTILTPQQRAALARALEVNLGRRVANADEEIEQSDTSRSQSTHSTTRDSSTNLVSRSKKKFKTGTIDLDAWSAKAGKALEVIEVTDDEFGDSDLLDKDILAASRSVELFKQQQIAKSSATKLLGSSVLRLIGGKKTTHDLKTEIQKQEAQLSFKERREKDIQAKKKRDAEALAKAKKNVGVAAQTSGEGSAVSNLGSLGKEHAPKGVGMMVSSGSDTDSDDELDQELFGSSTKTARVSAAVMDYNSARIQQARTQAPVKKTRQVRTARDMRARLAPDLSALHKTILSWEFFHNGDFPPNTDRDNYTLVTSIFRNPIEYQSTFEPLLILEAWQGFLKAKEEGYFKSFEIKVANRLTVDSFIEVSTTMDAADGKALGISEADIVLMSKAASPASDSSQPHCLARVLRITRKQKILEISYRVSVGNILMTSIVPNATLYGVKVSSITPLEREYGALLGLQYYDLCDEIVKARASPLLKYTDKQIEPIVNIYKVNQAQAKAVKSAIDNDAFTLIQGPPGSGKTKTIVAIVGALLTNALREVSGVKIARPQQPNGNVRPQSVLSTAKKLLVCAPSNAAVDELVMRLKDGVKTLSGEYHRLSIVRLGRSDNINAKVLDVTLDELVNAKLNIASVKKTNTGDDVGKLMMDHKATCEELNSFIGFLDEQRSKGGAQTPEQSRKVEVLKRRKQELSNGIDLLRDNGHTAARDAEISRRRIQQEILDNAHVLCATLSGSGHDMFQNLNIEFETVIIDEAAQSIELSALIPLKYGCAKCIMVGDPKQLPPTVLSREAARFQYEQSLFVRMQSNRPDDVHLLDTQYRMHPEISRFPSQAFYDGRLLNGPGMAKIRTKPWHQSQILSPYRFFDVQGAHQSAPKGHSLINLAELDVALQLFDRLITDCKGYDFTGKVGIITPYKSQLVELRSRFARKYGDNIFRTVEFNTTDAFQGRESEVIIFSCVRASAGGGIGFLSDIRRMNVGITRAKCSLWVLGNSQSLMQGEFWANLINDARRRDRYTQGNIIEILKRPTLLNGMNNPAAITEELDHSLGGQDVEMMDTPVLGGFAHVQVASRRPSIHEVMTGATQTQHPAGQLGNRVHTSEVDTYHPSGGNGLNVNAMCEWCGSYEHVRRFCNNEEAKKVAGRCWRCDNPHHEEIACNAERCVECGQFGHLANTCSNPNILSNSERANLRKAENQHKQKLSSALEYRRRRQMGDHDKSVPLVKSTRRTPPIDEQTSKGSKNGSTTSQKRKRQPSPPQYGPRGPKPPMNGAVRVPNYVAGPSVANGQRERLLISEPKPIDVPSSLPNSTSHSKGIVPDTFGSKTDSTQKNKNDNKHSLNGLSQEVPEAVKLNDMASERGHAEVNKASLPSKAHTAASTVGPPMQMRKKKEVDPFIRPNRRNRK